MKKPNSNKMRLFMMLLILCACIVCSCKINDERQSLKSTQPGSVELQPKAYTVLVNRVDADDVLEYKKVKMPKKINYLNMTCIKLLDRSTVLVGLYTEDGLTAHEEVGAYNFEKDTYKTYVTFSQKNTDELTDFAYMVSAVNETYIVFKVTRNNWGNTSIYLYNIKEDVFRKIYDYSIDPENGRNVYMNENSIVIQNDTIYFDNYAYDEHGEITVSILKYDCDSENITPVIDEAQNPMVYKGDIVFFTKNEEGRYKNIQSMDKETILDVKTALREVVSSGNAIYCIEDKHIKDLINNHNIMYTTKVVGWMDANAHFVTWYDYEGSTPCLYSIDLDSLIVFSGISEGINRVLVKDTYGLLFHSEDGQQAYYYFSLKKNP